jgi:hypothetical protein
VDRLQQIELVLGREVMDRESAPGGIRWLGPLRQRGDEVAMVELDLEGNTFKVLRRELERGL